MKTLMATGNAVLLLGLLSVSCGSDNTIPLPGKMGGSPGMLGKTNGGSTASTNGGAPVGSGGTALGSGGTAVGVSSRGGTSSSSAASGGAGTGGAVIGTGGRSIGGAPLSGGATTGGNGPASGGTVSTGGTATAAGNKATGGTATGGAATGAGGTATGGAATGAGGTATGGAATGAGGTAMGGAATSAGGVTGTGGTATGGKAAGGTPTGGTSSGGSPSGGTTASNPSFILGADISRVQQDEDRGVTYSDGGVQKPILDILKAHGFNYIRLRTFVDPTATGGYSSQGYCDLAHTVTFGKRVKDAGMGLLVDFHYSDTWADPGTQTKPAAWANLSLDALVQQVHDYTQDAVTRLKNGGARPDMVQIGNEIPSGMLFPDGRCSGQNFGNLNRLLNAGISGVHDVDAGIKIMLHIAFCQDLATTTWWLDGVMGIEPKVKFDIFAQSCYDEPNYQQPASNWEPNFRSLANNSKYNGLLFAVAEYSQNKRMVNDMLFNLPNQRGLGTFIWEPEYWRETIFDWQGNTEVTNSYMSLYDQMATDYGLR